LYDSTGGRNWANNDGWKQPVDVCEWHGITCGGEGNIEINTIALGSNNLIGRVPSEVFELPGLQYLWLYSNPIKFSFDGIEKATHLTSLQLDSVGLKSLDGVGKAPSLVDLLVRFNNFNGPLSKDIANLTNLETFFCGDSGMTGKLPSFSNNRKLSALRVGNNKFTGSLPSFSVHRRLRSLDVSDNQLSGDIPEDFLATAKTSQPIFLDLSNNQLSGKLPQSLIQFTSVTIFARDNRIDGISSGLCQKANWNEGDVQLYQCDGILCPPHTYSPKGRASDGQTCIYCKDAEYYGSSTCGNAVYGKSSAWSRWQSSLWLVLLAAPVGLMLV
jgi:hypothetical protein